MDRVCLTIGFIHTHQAPELRRRAEARESKAAMVREFGISWAAIYEYLRTGEYFSEFDEKNIVT